MDSFRFLLFLFINLFFHVFFQSKLSQFVIGKAIVSQDPIVKKPNGKDAVSSAVLDQPTGKTPSPPPRSIRKNLQKWIDNEPEVMTKVHQVRSQYEKQIQVRAALAEELTSLKREMDFASSPHHEKNGQFRFLSTKTRLERIASLESMLDVSSNALTAMASELSEAEEREHNLHTKTRWNSIKSMTDAKCLLHSINKVLLVSSINICELVCEHNSGSISLTGLIQVVTSPYGNNLHHQENVTHGQFAFTTQETGNYLACFWVDSSRPQANPLTLGIDWKIGIATKDWDSVAKKEKIEGVELQLRRLDGLVQSIRENINYIKDRYVSFFCLGTFIS